MRRLVATLIDVSVLTFVSNVVFYTGSYVGFRLWDVRDWNPAGYVDAVLVWWTAVIAVQVIYIVAAERHGGTFGKQLVGIAVVGPDGMTPPDVRTILARRVAQATFTVLLAATLWPWLAGSRHTVHDRLTATRVVEVDRATIPMPTFVRALHGKVKVRRYAHR